MEYYDEIFDLKPIFPEIDSNGRSIIKPQIADNKNNSSPDSTAKLISFESSNSPQMDQSSINHDINADYSLTSEIINFSSSTKEDSSSNDEYYPQYSQKRINSSAATRTPSQAMDHVVAERKRRENLSQLFISLSKVVPGLKKLDKASLLEDGINYVKAMQERVRILEEEEEGRNAAVKEDLSSSSSYNGGKSDGPEIQARISDKHVLIKMFCKNKKGLMTRIPNEMMEIMHLNVVDMRIMPFGGTALDITILAEMQREFEGTAKDIVEHLHTLFLNY